MKNLLILIITGILFLPTSISASAQTANIFKSPLFPDHTITSGTSDISCVGFTIQSSRQDIKISQIGITLSGSPILIQYVTNLRLVRNGIVIANGLPMPNSSNKPNTLSYHFANMNTLIKADSSEEFTVMAFVSFPDSSNGVGEQVVFHVSAVGLNTAANEQFTFPEIEAQSVFWKFNTTSISEPIRNEITVYPNPCSNYFEISGEHENISVFNTSGQMIYEGNETRIEITGWPVGVYYINIDGQIQKLIKE